MSSYYKKLLVDLHCHSIFSDGELIPAELVRRLEVRGYSCVAITDHADHSNIDFILPRIVQAAEILNRSFSTKLLPGIELTHVPPDLIPELAIQARELGAKIVVVHGETLAEPVAPGTNRAAIESDIDILAHPGLISVEDVALAAKRGIFLELSARKGHCLTNGHVARLARRYGAKLIVDSDAHAPDDFMLPGEPQKIAEGAGLSISEVEELFSILHSWLEDRFQIELPE